MTNREMERLVAEKVLGWEVEPDGTIDAHGWWSMDTFRPSRDIIAAWVVFESLGRGGTCQKWIERIDSPLHAEWRCEVQTEDATFRATAPTAPLAICLTALATVGLAEPASNPC